MKSLIHTFIKNPVLVHMITIGVIVFGTFSFLSMPRELSPNLNFYWMVVEVWYPGVSPEEIEKLVTKPIEDEISDVKNIKTLIPKFFISFSFNFQKTSFAVVKR